MNRQVDQAIQQAIHQVAKELADRYTQTCQDAGQTGPAHRCWTLQHTGNERPT